MMQPTGHTWLLTRIGPTTRVRVDVDGPMGVAEIDHLMANLTLARKWREEEEAQLRLSMGGPPATNDTDGNGNTGGSDE